MYVTIQTEVSKVPSRSFHDATKYLRSRYLMFLEKNKQIQVRMTKSLPSYREASQWASISLSLSLSHTLKRESSGPAPYNMAWAYHVCKLHWPQGEINGKMSGLFEKRKKKNSVSLHFLLVGDPRLVARRLAGRASMGSQHSEYSICTCRWSSGVLWSLLQGRLAFYCRDACGDHIG